MIDKSLSFLRETGRRMAKIGDALTRWARAGTAALLCGLSLAAAAAAQEPDSDLLAEARELGRSGRPAEAARVYERLLAQIEGRDGAEAWALVHPLYELAVQHHALGGASEAELLYRRSLAIAEKHRGPQDPALVPSLRGLATVAATQGRLSEAEALYRRALKIQETEAKLPPELARTLAELGLLSQMQGRATEAERFYRRALEVGDARGLSEEELATIAGNLGAICVRQGRFADAEPHYRRVLAIRESSLGPDHPDLARPLEQLARLQVQRRRFAEAASFYERSLRLREASEPGDVALAGVLDELAATYRQLGRETAAEAHFDMAKAILAAQCSGREGTPACRDARRIHERLESRPPEAAADSALPIPPPPAAETIAAPEPAAGPGPATSPAPIPASAPSAPPPPPESQPSRARPATARVHRAQVAARRDPRAAEMVLETLRDAHPDLLAGLTARVVSADLGERGVWHRVQIGEFEDAADAKALCAELLRRGHDGCWVIATGGG